MWEIILFVMAGLLGGWGFRGIIDRRTYRSQQTGKPEMMWFNNQKSQWERVTEMQLLVADRVVAAVPVKLVDKRKSDDNR
jgi:hypothetical protein|tara:strand:- start:954 stop:1193 length:240 start_codon:yes stop_codon:yes gene_type:complete